MKKNDIFLIIAALLILIPLVIVLLNSKNGDKALVKRDGKVIDILDLSKDSVYTYEDDSGFNTVSVENGKIHVIEADCPGHDCINKGFISRNNESIICLPHHLEVTISSNNEEFDVLVQ